MTGHRHADVNPFRACRRSLPTLFLLAALSAAPALAEEKIGDDIDRDQFKTCRDRLPNGNFSEIARPLDRRTLNTTDDREVRHVYPDAPIQPGTVAAFQVPSPQGAVATPPDLTVITNGQVRPVPARPGPPAPAAPAPTPPPLTARPASPPRAPEAGAGPRCARTLETLEVAATNPEPTLSRTVLEAGRPYALEIAGTYSFWDDRREGADALFLHTGASPEPGGYLSINDKGLDAWITEAGGTPGYQSHHVYRLALTGTGEPLSFRINDSPAGYAENSGYLTVTVCVPAPPGQTQIPTVPPLAPARTPAPPATSPAAPPAAPALLETIEVSAATPQPTVTRSILEKGHAYLLEVSGVFSFRWGRKDGVDALYHYGSRSMKMWSSLLINDRRLRQWIEAAGGSTAYREDHRYRVTLTGRGAPLSFKIHDGGNYSDNSGHLVIKIQKADS